MNMTLHIGADAQESAISDTLHHRSAMLDDVGKLLAEVNTRIVYCSLGKTNAEAGRKTYERCEVLLRALSILLVDQDRRYFRAVHGAADAEEREARQRRIAELSETVARLQATADNRAGALAGMEALAYERSAQLTKAVEQVAFLEGDRMAIVAERNEAQERVRELEATVVNLRRRQPDGGDPIAVAVQQVHMLLKSSDVDALKARDSASLTAQERAEVALWDHMHHGRVIRFLGHLATMTDTEADFIDGKELRTLAQMLQLADDQSQVAVPRLYDENDRHRAAQALADIDSDTMKFFTRDHARRAVDAVAEALGMRRAGA